MSSLLVINPNTSLEMTEQIKKTIQKISHKDHEVIYKNSDIGPESLESFYEYSLATLGVLRVIAEEKGKYDGILLACFGDPGLYAIKEVAGVPIIGIAEASLSTALLLGQSFSILVALKKAVPMMENMVLNYGLSKRLASVEPLATPVLDLEKSRQQTIEKMLKVGKKAMDKGAEILILGCAGMTGFSTILEKELGITVIDPIATGYKVLESLVELNLNVSRCGIYAPPAPKKILGDQVFKLGAI